MPYITQEEREPLNPVIQKLFDLCMDEVTVHDAKGRINFCITKLVHLWALEYMKGIESIVKKYKILNDAYGIICSATTEFYNAVVLPYEKLVRIKNGPVSQLDDNPLGEALPEFQYKCDKCARGFDIPFRKIISGRFVFYCPHCKSEIIPWIDEQKEIKI